MILKGLENLILSQREKAWIILVFIIQITPTYRFRQRQATWHLLPDDKEDTPDLIQLNVFNFNHSARNNFLPIHRNVTFYTFAMPHSCGIIQLSGKHYTPLRKILLYNYTNKQDYHTCPELVYLVCRCSINLFQQDKASKPIYYNYIVSNKQGFWYACCFQLTCN